MLIVSLGATPGWRDADAALASGLRTAGLSVELAVARRPREVRTFALTDLTWALAARRAARAGIAAHHPRAVIYSTITAALLWPRRGAIRFDEAAAGNRPGRHGLWQRPLERRRLARAPLLLALSDGGARAVRSLVPQAADPIVVPAPIAGSGPGAPPSESGRDVAALTYAAAPEKKGLDRVLAAWAQARHAGELLVVAGLEPERRATWLARAGLGGVAPAAAEERLGVRFIDLLPYDEYRALLRRTRLHVTAPRHEDHGITQLEALADGCMLVTTAPAGPYPALELARELDPRLVGDDVAGALRIALDDPARDYPRRAGVLLEPLAPERVAQTIRERVAPALAR